ncbi:hypothetical protein [Diplocloster modestus]|uniref:GIY-YIG homing endonuclease n=1 Tax=Diplocloster modestus TaxID=2850322 RepID=A0ABS6KCP0_9FIRM|nr:hypothetical protein [Diplocloster modestus]MBU9728287.1 hypothetical protein [Diplocloster modestus]
MVNELQIAWERAISIESIGNYGGDKYGLEYIGGINRNEKIYKFFKDDEGRYWYSSENSRKEKNERDSKRH